MKTLDNEIKDMLIKILERQSRLEIESKRQSIKIETMLENIKRSTELQNGYNGQKEILFDDSTDPLTEEKTDLLSNLIHYCKKRFRRHT